MYSSVEFRSVIKFLVLKKLPAKEIIEELRNVYHDESPSKTTIYDWIAQFKHGRQSVFDKKSPGRPLEIGEEIKEKLENIVKFDKRITTKMLCDSLNVSTGSLDSLIRSMGLRKLSSRFVPRFLTSEMCENRLSSCQANLMTLEQVGDIFLQNIVTVDETPLSLYLPDTKQESKEWKFPGETSTKKLRASTCHRKSLMLTVFWDFHGVVSIDFADNDVKINSCYYVEQVKKARKSRRKSRKCNLYFLQDNAPIHKSAFSTSEIEKVGFHSLPHPPYLPDLAPSDFYLFLHLKKHLRGRHFTSKEELREVVQEFLENQPSIFYENAFLELVRRWKKCVQNGGSYIEK